ncbi:hypothetical protein [Prosthecobacter sp.]|uniref:hypothetical protein n=1 Tax=Prosthecobacter sp. TaxID=1965333 RepID=UPI0037851AA4
MSFHSSSETLGPENAVWDDGEWVGWSEMNRYVEEEAAELEEGGWDVLEEDEEWLELDERSASDPAPEREASTETRGPSREVWKQLMKLIRQADEAQEKGEDIGRQIGEIGEVFAEAKFGLKRHRQCAQGSDGKIGNDFVEVKTLSPWKKITRVRVKLAGHWNKLILVRISDPWILEAQIFRRAELVPMKGCKRVTANWKPRKKTVLPGRDEAAAKS